MVSIAMAGRPYVIVLRSIPPLTEPTAAEPIGWHSRACWEWQNYSPMGGGWFDESQ